MEDGRTNRIRVLLVDDSPIALVVLRRLLGSAPDLHVVGAAQNGAEALALISQVQPHVIVTDLHMPVMDGFRFVREAMMKHPIPVLGLSASLDREQGASNAFRFLDAGAVDVMLKPEAGLNAVSEQMARELIARIRVVSRVKVVTRFQRPAAAPPSPSAPPPAGAQKDRIVAIGTSTGGPQALQVILSSLPGDFPAPILCVQHITVGFLTGMVEWLGGQCALAVRTAQVWEPALPGVVYFAPEGAHLGVGDAGKLLCPVTPPVDGHRPSATFLFESVAARYGPRAVGVLLTGMGKDGARGLLAVARAGGDTIAQDEGTSVVFGMPAEAVALGAAKRVLPVQEIGPMLDRLLRGKVMQR